MYSELDPNTEFHGRHIGPTADDQGRMLQVVGAASLSELIHDIVPASILDESPLNVPGPHSESAALARLKAIAERNEIYRNYIGQGYYGTHVPNVILRNILENPAWYTAYTPYQPEISQGRLEALLNYQTMVANLTGLDIANASLLDEGTAAAEAMTLARRGSRVKSNVFFASVHCHPQTLEVLRTRASGLDIEVQVGDEAQGLPECFGVLLQYPHSLGGISDYRALTEAAHKRGAVVAVATDLLALALLTPPGEWGADIAVGSAQRFGVPMGYGGPHAGFIACREEDVRSLPGRLVGVSRDRHGRIAYRLTLQTREQHIRREKATSNVCTAQVLLAVVAALYACYHGPEGLKAIAQRVNRLTGAQAAALEGAGHTLVNETWFDTLTVSVPGGAAEILARASDAGINLGRVDADHVRIAFDETCDESVVSQLCAVFNMGTAEPAVGIPDWAVRESDFMTHPVFSMYRSEHEMLRYLRRLSDKDLALDRTMIPLGSCTMKLNATTEMIPMTWPEFGRIHPYAPGGQVAGYLELIRELESYLAEITGYDRVSLQPNAGSQGELAGLLAIAAYHRSRGDEQRTICLIPASAHGTNAASAVMAGMDVVVVATDEKGNIDLDDLEAKAETNSDRLAAVMVTYPSTHGVFEPGIRRLADIVHSHGGQVYVDGANLNAMVGLAKPGHFGADVGHLNLHKTFTIPHGGGGPGIGPVGAREHLAPFLPNHPLVPEAGPETGIGPISGAPFGSAGILPIPYSYIRLMGADGLRKASQVAILAANYIAARLGEYFPVLYTGSRGRVAHECILDLRPMTKATGVTAEDVAKRLADYGFHAPTLSFPVAGTLMVEPTESESLAELDRFCDAMIAIKAEADRVGSGEWPEDDNPLRMAPHTAEEAASDEWTHPYSRETAVFPVPSVRMAKYWPPVSRIDGPGGDRNLMCACPPLEEFVGPA